MAPKTEKPSKKDVKKTTGDKDSKKKRTKRSGETFSTYVSKVLKSMNAANSKDKDAKPLTMSKKSMSIMNSFLTDCFEKIAHEAGQLCKYHKKETLSSREVQNAIKLVLPVDLALHAVEMGARAVSKAIAEKKN